MFSSATPASFSTSIAVMAEPPVASCTKVVERSARQVATNEEQKVGWAASTNHRVAQDNIQVGNVRREL